MSDRDVVVSDWDEPAGHIQTAPSGRRKESGGQATFSHTGFAYYEREPVTLDDLIDARVKVAVDAAMKDLAQDQRRFQ